jgi:hypothetical protein
MLAVLTRLFALARNDRALELPPASKLRVGIDVVVNPVAPARSLPSDQH